MFSLVQFKRNNATTGQSVTVTLTSAPTQGNLVVVCLRDNVNTDTYTLTGYTKAGQVLTSNASTVIWYKIAGAGESATIAPGVGGLSTFEIVAMEFSTDLGVPIFRGYSKAGPQASGTSIQASALMPLDAVYLAVVMAGTSLSSITSPAIDSGFSLIDAGNVVYAVTGYKAGSAMEQIAPIASWVGSAGNTASMVVFVSEPGGAPPPKNVLRPGMFKPGNAR